MCSAQGCKKKDFKDGLCSTHWTAAQGPRGPQATYNFVFAPGPGGGAPNAKLTALGASLKKGEEYAKRITHLTSLGPQAGGEEDVHGTICLHDTQKSNNLTVFFTWAGNTMTVHGLGGHKGGDGAGNDNYDIACWKDGTKKSWKRPSKKKVKA